MTRARPAQTDIVQPRPSITATIVRGEGLGRTVTVDRDELVELIRRVRSRQDPAGDSVDPGTITIGRHPLGDNHLFIGDGDRSISNIHLQVTPIEEDAVRIVHCGRSGNAAIDSGAVRDAIAPGETRTCVLPVELVIGNPPSVIAIRHEDPCPVIDDGPGSWDDLSTAQRRNDNRAILAATGKGFAALCAAVLTGFAAERVVVANRDEVLAVAGGLVEDQEREHLWRWYAFNGRAYRLRRDLTAISLADGRSPALGHGLVLRLMQNGTYLHVLRRADGFLPVDRERLTRIGWHVLAGNADHADWFPRMHLEDHEPALLRRLVGRCLDDGLVAAGVDRQEAVQRIAPRITRDTGIIFPRRARKQLSANAGLDVPRRHLAVAQASQSRYYHRLTDMLDLFVSDGIDGASPMRP